jgi:pimeloyl-ACP methyl ester carboxylesterase
MLRQAASRNSLPMLPRAFAAMDVRDRLPQLTAPTLVVQRDGDRIVRPGVARYLASMIPGAQLALLPGEDHLMWCGDTGAVIERVEAFMDSAAPMRPAR